MATAAQVMTAKRSARLRPEVARAPRAVPAALGAVMAYPQRSSKLATFRSGTTEDEYRLCFTTMGNNTSGSRTLGTAFDRSMNSLNAIRLVLALLVIVSHSWAIGGFGPEPELGGTHLGTWAVLGFFAISGYLITASRLGSGATRFYRARFLRIFPAFFVCLILIAGLLAPLSTLVDGTWSVGEALTYVARNIALYPPHLAQDGIAGTLMSVPYQSVWDGSLWTLFWEAGCYVLIGLTVSLLPRRAVLPAVFLGFLASTALATAGATGAFALPGLSDRVVPLVATFLAGSLVFLVREQLPLSTVTVVVAAAWLLLAAAIGLVQQVGGLPIAFLLLALGCRREASAIGRKYDASYGFYIYAWPIQQMVVLLLGQRSDVWIVIVVSICATAPLAYLSSALVERPALRLNKKSQDRLVLSAPVP
jgi:peptidoglycan/LPS O-acetylase OafA/YrhL